MTEDKEEEFKSLLGAISKPTVVWKPDLSPLEEVFAYNELNLIEWKIKKGSRVVVECSTDKWRDTYFATVSDIKDDGTIWLTDEDYHRACATSLKAIQSGKHVVKILPPEYLPKHLKRKK